ncbi:hypothetical protein WAI453_004927 [Rhynchosporium graminicola]
MASCEVIIQDKHISAIRKYVNSNLDVFVFPTLTQETQIRGTLVISDNLRSIFRRVKNVELDIEHSRWALDYTAAFSKDKHKKGCMTPEKRAAKEKRRPSPFGMIMMNL